jgi:hypothetical protein
VLRLGAPMPKMQGSLVLLTHPTLRSVTRIRAVLDHRATCRRAASLIEERESKLAA